MSGAPRAPPPPPSAAGSASNIARVAAPSLSSPCSPMSSISRSDVSWRSHGARHSAVRGSSSSAGRPDSAMDRARSRVSCGATSSCVSAGSSSGAPAETSVRRSSVRHGSKPAPRGGGFV